MFPVSSPSKNNRMTTVANWRGQVPRPAWFVAPGGYRMKRGGALYLESWDDPDRLWAEFGETIENIPPVYWWQDTPWPDPTRPDRDVS